jgi:hypothetical protein
MHLLQSGVDIAVIALWLGHESIETTHGYVEADLEAKQRALDKLATRVPARSADTRRLIPSCSALPNSDNRLGHAHRSCPPALRYSERGVSVAHDLKARAVSNDAVGLL